MTADGEESGSTASPDLLSDRQTGGEWSRWLRRIFGIGVAVAVARVAHGILLMTDHYQSAALYVGIPVLIATIIVTIVPDGSCLRLSVIASTLALIGAFITLPEAGFFIALATPVILGVAAFVGMLADAVKAAQDSIHYGFVVVAFLSLDGTHPALDLPRHETVISAASVRGSAASFLASSYM